MTPEDVRFLWNDVLRRGQAFLRAHFYDQYVAIDIHIWLYVGDLDELAAVLSEYCVIHNDVAIGETGIEST